MNTKLMNVAIVLVIISAAVFLFNFFTEKAGEGIQTGVEAVDQLKQENEVNTITDLVRNDPRLVQVLAFKPSGYHDVAYEVLYGIDGMYAMVKMTYLDYANGQNILEIPVFNQGGRFTIGQLVTGNRCGTLTLDELAALHTE